MKIIIKGLEVTGTPEEIAELIKKLDYVGVTITTTASKDVPRTYPVPAIPAGEGVFAYAAPFPSQTVTEFGSSQASIYIPGLTICPSCRQTTGLSLGGTTKEPEVKK